MSAGHQRDGNASTKAAVAPFQLTPDQAARVIRIEASGLWSEEDLTAHAIEVSDQIEKWRRSGNRIRALIDLSAAPVQSPKVLSSTGIKASTAFKRGDRVAVICTSVMFKRQLDRFPTEADRRFFSNAEEALAWLLEE